MDEQSSQYGAGMAVAASRCRQATGAGRDRESARRIGIVKSDDTKINMWRSLPPVTSHFQLLSIDIVMDELRTQVRRTLQEPREFPHNFKPGRDAVSKCDLPQVWQNVESYDHSNHLNVSLPIEEKENR